MSIHLELNYGKKIGLPEYSSHNFSVSLKTEIPATDDIPVAVERVYRILQESVDAQITQPGYVPGSEVEPVSAPNSNLTTMPPQWKCSPKQKELILKLVDEQGLDRNAVDKEAQDRFGKRVTQLNKLEASGLIDTLMQQGSRKGNQRRAA
jgi:hypothetical protein